MIDFKMVFFKEKKRKEKTHTHNVEIHVSFEIEFYCHVTYYRKQATNRVDLTLIFLFFNVGTIISQFRYLNKMNGSLNISAEK